MTERIVVGGRNRKLLVTLSDREYLAVGALASAYNYSMARTIREALALMIRIESAKKNIRRI